MKNKIVIWGTNEQEEKVLIALELQAERNKVMLYTFPEAIADDAFVNKMMADWREGGQVEFPEGHAVLERELSVTESLLPENLKVERGDLIQRAQTEWHFAVLSTKLHAAYEQELAELRERVKALSSYDQKVFNNLRAFWDKVQVQSRERNLFREHVNILRDRINELFEDLKKIRQAAENEFMEASGKVFEEFNKMLDGIEERIAAGGAKLNSVFDELKQLQRKYKEARLGNEHRNKVWDRLDAAFKAAKARKFGPEANEGSLAERHERRVGGLQEAMQRMEESIRRDEEELNFQQKKVHKSEGQLEAQIRMAKIKMIEERINAKKEKLADMLKTKEDLERQVDVAKEKEQKRAEKEAERQRMSAARERAKSEIAAGIRTKNIEGDKDESLFEAATTVIGDVLLNALDTVKAVASVAADKAEDIAEQVAEKAEAFIEQVAEKIEDVAEQISGNQEEKREEAAQAPAEAVVEETPAAVEAVVEETVAEVEAVVEETPAVVEAVVEETVTAAETVVEETPAVVEAVVEETVTAAEALVEETPAVVEAVVEETVTAAETLVEETPAEAETAPEAASTTDPKEEEKKD